MNTHRKIDIMGIINVTDDSFYSGSRYLDGNGCANVERIACIIREMVSQGASIIDIGACSSRPGAEMPEIEEEWRRLESVCRVLPELLKSDGLTGVKISVDTFRAEIVRRVFESIGPFMVNDISAGQYDDMMLSTVGDLGLEYVAMHLRGTPATMREMTDYSETGAVGLSPVSYAVKKYFKEFEIKAERYGIKHWIMDPGFGFAKDIGQNYALMREIDKIKEDNRRLLVGVSRKSMIYKMLGISIEDSLPATQVLHLIALQKGADILRVHDVAEASRTVALFHQFEK